jgi:GMP synthase (glutamine-hydrolysing)
MLIGILQCGEFPTADGFPDRTYDDLYTTLLADRGLTFRTWKVLEMEFPSNVHEAEGWLITGSRHGAYEDLPFIPPLESFIRKAERVRTPMVGICFGHQIMAQALGGRVEKFSKGWSVGLVDYDIEGEQVPLNAWHQDQVVDKPETAKVIGSSEFCRYAMLSYGNHALSIQPHPEFDAEAVRLLLETRAPGVVPKDQINAANGKLDLPAAQTKTADRIATFYKEAAHG